MTALDAPHVLPYDASLRGWWLYPEDLWDGRAESIQSLADHLLQRSSFQPIGLDQSLTLVMKESQRDKQTFWKFEVQDPIHMNLYTCSKDSQKMLIVRYNSRYS